jgi:very-short-patch-repair endonuclease
MGRAGEVTTWTKAALKKLLRENSDVTLLDPRALAQRPVSAAVRAVNSREDVAALTAPEDVADTLLAEIKRLAPHMAQPIRDYPFDRYKIDLAWPSAMLAIEVDGGQHAAGGGKHGSRQDYAKTRRMTVARWRLLRFTAGEVRDDPMSVIKEIQEAL